MDTDEGGVNVVYRADQVPYDQGYEDFELEERLEQVYHQGGALWNQASSWIYSEPWRY